MTKLIQHVRPWVPHDASSSVRPRPPELWTAARRMPADPIEAQLDAAGCDADDVGLFALLAFLRRLDRIDRGALALRGSMLLRAWAKDRFVARQPKDIDLVALHAIDADTVTSILRHAATLDGDGDGDDDGVSFDADHVVQSETWPYSAVPGLRFQVPWTLGRWRGAAQVDVALDELAHSGPLDTTRTTLPGVLIGLDAVVNACSPEVSLAWKLRWLSEDTVAQAKDLWDALCIVRHVDLDPFGVALALVNACPGFDHIALPLDSHWRMLLAGLKAAGAAADAFPATAEDAREALRAEIVPFIALLPAAQAAVDADDDDDDDG